MLLIDEKLNSSIPKTLELYNNRDENALIKIIKQRSEADFLDINTALCENEKEMLIYMIGLVQKNSSEKIMLDSSDPQVIAEAAEYIKGDFAINSVTAKERLELLPVIKKYNCYAVALPIEDNVPEDPEERLENALKIKKACEKEGINTEKIFFDILITPLSTDTEAGKKAYDTLKLFRKEGLKTVCGLSNGSFGLPKRKIINSFYLSHLMTMGLDGAICDTEDLNIKTAVKCSEMLMGNDEYCMEYVMFAKEEL